MNESNSSNRDFEKLSKAITEAVMSSGKVKKIVEEISKKASICPQSFMVLVLKMEVLADAFELDIEEASVETKKPKRGRKKPDKSRSQQIDGRSLTPNELAFEEYVNQRFDDKEWLRKNGLIL
tara:strand:+ start:812 stop:1180 length:369 start_codon:yes stop_codon:yes gene_type:complete